VWMTSWDGAQTVRLTWSPESESSPRWSPDNRYLAFVSSRQEGKGGQVIALRAEQEGSPLVLKADLVLLAMGFTGPLADGVVAKAGASPDLSGYGTARPGIFACGDARRGQSLIVWAIREGRDCAVAVDAWLASARL